MGASLTLKSLFNQHQSNEWLMIRYAKSGDKALLEQLYNNCSDDLYHFILTQSDVHLANDICQKTWQKVIEKPHLYQQSGRFSAWLFTIARNALVDEYRKTNRWSELAMDTPDKRQGPEQVSKDLQTEFNTTLLALPFEQREAFCLQQEGFGIQEIADITNSPAETIKSRLRYAKQFLRQKLEAYHE